MQFRQVGRKFLTFVALLSMVTQSMSPYLYALPRVAYAQEVDSTSSPQADTPSDTPSVTPDQTDSTSSPQAQEVTPALTEPTASVAEPTPEVSVTPEPTSESTVAPQENQENNNSPPSDSADNNSNNSQTPNPTVDISPTGSSLQDKEDGYLDIVILENTAAPTIDLNSYEAQESASLVTDKPDYAPTDTAIISGTGFSPGETYTLVITSEDEPPVHFETSVTADENGSFVYAYQLDGNYRPNYKVEVKDSDGNVITHTSFTDATLKLYKDASRTTEGYQFALGDTVHAQASGLNTNHGFKFDVKDLDGTVIPGTTTICITGDAIPGFTYTTTDISDNRDFTFELHEWNSNNCSGSESGGSPMTKTFNVASATAYTTSVLTDETTSYGVGSTAYIVVRGLDQGKNDWSTTWIKPGPTDACDNSGGGDRPDSNSNGALPDATPAYLEYPPSANDNKWNDPDRYDDDCEAFSASNAGAWRLELRKDVTHSVTLSVFTLSQPNTPPSFDAIADQTVDENSPSQNVSITNVLPGPSGESGQTVIMSATSSNPTIVPNPSVSGAGSTRTLTYTPANNQFGTVTITVTANDGQSENNTFSRTFTITVNQDTTPPTDPQDVHSTSHDIDTASSDNTITMAWTVAGSAPGATDAGSGVDGYSFSFTTGVGDVPDVTKDAEEDTIGTTSDLLIDQSWWFHLRTVDNEGNWTSTVHVGPYIIDTTAPSSDIDYPVDEETYTEDSWNGEIQGTATDEPSSGVSKVYVSIQADNGDYWCDENECGDEYGWYSEDEGETLNETDFNSENGNWSYEFDFISEEGTQGYTVRSHAEDNAGNLEETNTVHFYFQTDTTPPVSTIDSPQEGTFWNEPIEISGSSTDEPDTTVDYVNFYYRTSGEVENPWIEIPGSQQSNKDEEEPFEWSFNWTPDSEGTFDIKAEATDKVGNIENSPVVEYVTYDVTGPVVSTPSASPDPTNHPPQILADAVDAISNIVSAIFSVDDPDFLFAKPLEALDGFFGSLAETLFGPENSNGMDYPGEGLHTLYVGAYDEAGNFGSNSGPFTVDTNAPTVESAQTQDQDGDGYIDGIKLTFSENIDDSRLNQGEADGWDVDNYDGESIGSGENVNDNILLLTFSEGGSQDTGTTPNVSYTQSDGGRDGDGDILLSTHDLNGNELASNTWSTTDRAAPTSSFSSPPEGSFWNGPIEASGSSTDTDILSDGDTVDFVRLFWRTHSDNGDELDGSGDELDGNDNPWTEIDTDPGEVGTQPLTNSDRVDPFNWSFDWTPPEENSFDIKAEATDTAGNTETSPVVTNVTYDTTAPATPSADPAAGDYTSDQAVTLSSSDLLSGVDKIYYTSDGSTPDNTKTLYSDPVTVDKDMTIKAIAYDLAGNASEVLSADYGIPPQISAESSSSVSTSSVTITWTTDELATSRVVYDTVSHAVLGAAPNYGYATSTIEVDTAPKVTSHSVEIADLTAGTTYYYRTVSHGSPEAVGDENSFTTTSPAVAGATTSGGGGDGGGGTASAPSCDDSKPGSAPTLTGASAGTNSVTLTWSEASDPVTYYLATYGTSSGAQQFGNPHVGGKGTTSYTVSGLSGGVTYYFKVRAGNGCAPGDYSNELSAAPVGEFVQGPAQGFAPGVLGEETKKEGEALGEATPSGEPKVQEQKGTGLFTPRNILTGAVILMILLLIYLWYRKSK
ncbi:MAG: chitobiase/beta-hexosaminidase C-terminal domain-containing protein [Candidatus Levybacteria bacterium]|nr:chitobiase/beta-hexosaminidase C-terminal domain-containing protein [Candidatus Levybacteria bacterium]